MDGIHDMGGMQGFGVVPLETDTLAFHEEWEGRVFAINWAILATAGLSIDSGRAGIERLSPADYLSLPYFGRWLSAICNSLVESGVFSSEQMDAIRSGQVPEQAVAPSSAVEPALSHPGLDLVLKGSPTLRSVNSRPAFQVGDGVRGKKMHPPGHTRIPRYVRGCRGMVVADRAAHVFPDTNAAGQGENACHLYAVRFAARELWGETVNNRDSVTLDLWEPYLESA